MRFRALSPLCCCKPPLCFLAARQGGGSSRPAALAPTHPPVPATLVCLFVQEQRKRDEAAEKAAAADKEGGADAKPAADAKAEAAAAEEEKEEPIPEPAMPARPQLQVGLCLHQLGFSCVAVVGLVWQGIEREEKERPSPLPAGEFRAPACLQLRGGCVVGVARSRGGGAGSQGPLRPQLQVCSAVAHHAAKRGAGDQRCPLGRSCGWPVVTQAEGRGCHPPVLPTSVTAWPAHRFFRAPFCSWWACAPTG